VQTGWPHPELLQAVFDDSPVGVGVFDVEGYYLQVNPALAAIIGLPKEDIVGRHIGDLLGDLGRRAAALQREVARTGRPVRNQTLVGRTLSGAGDRSFLVSYFRLGSNGTAGVASVVIDVTEQQRVRDELERANERLTMLGQASAVLSESLDLRRTLAALADVVVPRLADHCLVDLIDESGRFRRRALSSAPGCEPPTGVWGRPGSEVSYPPGHPTAEASASGRSVLVSGVPSDFDFESVAPTPESAAFARDIGLTAALAVPLVARGEQLGVLSLAMSRSGRRFVTEDVAVAEQLASRAAVAIDNALLFQREQRVALSLQRHLLPEQLPHAEGLLAAASYLPAAGGRVGGDWYDVIELAAGRAAIVIGDVMGRGLTAAALMGQLRAATRAYAVQDLPPAEVLRHLNELLRGLAQSTIATCVYAVYDAAEDKLCLANAGHLPPLLLDRHGARRLDGGGPPLGVGGEPYQNIEIEFPSSAALVLYTDGLVETRENDLDQGIDALIEALTPPPATLEEIPARALGLLGPESEGHLDDVAILAVRPDSLVAPEMARVLLPGQPPASGEARSFLEGAAKAWRLDGEVTQLAMLLASELVTNAVRHGAGSVELRLHRAARSLFIEVVDESGRMPHQRRPPPDDEQGRGLDLVDALAASWGARRLPDAGKVVWCAVRLPPPGG
jgi:PAS domain S-box-containing protein